MAQRFTFRKKPWGIGLFSPSSTKRQNQALVLNVLFLGALFLVGSALIALIYYFVAGYTYVANRIAVAVVVAAILFVAHRKRRQHYNFAAYSLLVLYFLAGTAVLLQWGIEASMGVLLFCLVITFAGILLSARYSLYMLLLVMVVLGALTYPQMRGITHPDLLWKTRDPDFSNFVAFGMIFGNLALVSWLFNRSTEHALERALRSEQALRRQKELLEIKVEERTRQVQAAQVERVQDLYRFAELGHMSVALLHELANYLSVLTLDIENLREARRGRSAAVRRIEQSIRHLNSLIAQVRNQIKGETSVTRFNVVDEMSQVVELLRYKANARHIALEWQKPSDSQKLHYTGSVTHFWQIMMNITSNALDSYQDMPHPEQPRVILAAKHTDKGIVISVTDFGVGIPPARQKKIFDPFYSTKKEGSGIGLAIAKRMVEKDLGGKIAVSSKPRQGTTFTVTLPHHK